MSKPLKFGIAAGFLAIATNPIPDYEFITRTIGIIGFFITMDNLYAKEDHHE